MSKSVCGFFKGNCLGLQKFLPLTQSLMVLQPEVVGLIFLALESRAGGSGMGLRLLAPQISLPNFYPSHVDVGPTFSASLPPPYQSGWMWFL